MLTSQKNSLIAAMACVGVLGLTGCGGGSSGGESTPQELINAQSVTKKIDAITSTVANCERSALSAANIKQAQQLIELTRSMVVEADQPVTRVRTTGAATGSCASQAGEATVTSTHNKGITDYDMTFDGYCATGPKGDSVLDGHVYATEIGTPSEVGPVISQLLMQSSGISVQGANATRAAAQPSAKISFSNIKTVYGRPMAWTPGVPTAAAPDQTTAGLITIELPALQEKHQLKNLSLKRVGGDTAQVTVVSGQYINPQGEAVNLSTPDNQPLTIRVPTGELVSGQVVLKGQQNSQATISAGTGTRVFDVTVNGTPLTDQQLSCANADAPIEEVLSVALARLPIY
jgi:hypothetical protein